MKQGCVVKFPQARCGISHTVIDTGEKANLVQDMVYQEKHTLVVVWVHMVVAWK